MRQFRIMATATLAVALAGGCGSSTAQGTGSPDGGAGVSRPAGNGVAALAPKDILVRASAAMAKVGSVHISGTGTSDGQSFKIDMKIKDKTGASGSLTLPIGSTEDNSSAGQVQVDLLIVDGAAYIKPSNENFWSIFTGGAVDTEKLKGKWVKASTSNEKLQFILAFGDLTALSSQILKPDGALTKGEQKDIRGTKAIGLTDSGADKTTFYIATEGEPLPLQVTAGGKDTGAIDFLDYGKPVEVPAPPTDQVVDGKDAGIGS